MALNSNAVSFNGTDQYIIFNTDASIRGRASFSFMSWFKVGVNSTRTDQHAYVERHGTGGNIRFHFTPIKGKLIFGFAARDGDNPTSYTYNTRWDDRWHHAVFSARIGTSSDSTYDITLDGVVVADGTLIVPSGVEKISDTVSKGIYAGNHSRALTGATFPPLKGWHGLLDDIILLKSGSGQGNVTSYYSSNSHWTHDKTNENDPTIEYWSFDGQSQFPYTNGLIVGSRSASYNKGGVASTTLWTPDRPFMGDGLKDITAPTAPGNPQHTDNTSDSFKASWSASTDNVWVQFYELQVSEYSNFSSYVAFDTGRLRSKLVKGLFPSTNYYWRVRALDAELNASPYSSVRSLTTTSFGDIQPPSPPTNISISYLTHSSFRVSFTNSVSDDVLGYKLDVGLDRNFAQYLLNHRGKTLGNISQVDIFGVEPLQSYYVRLRAYDSSDNESDDSVVIRVNTPRRPDTVPPLTVEGISATGVSARSATLSWEEGVDNIGVAGYYLDVSTDIDFSQYTLTTTHHWQAVDVGNVRTYFVSDLNPDTLYFYRVRAYDDANNISPNSESPIMFRTEPSSMYEGGTISSGVIMSDWRTTTQVKPNVLEVSSAVTSYLVFNIAGTVGTVIGGILQFTPKPYVGTTTLGKIDIRVRELGQTAAGATIQYTITQLNSPVDIDISSLLQSTTSIIYEIEIARSPTGGFTGFLDAGVSVESFNINEVEAPSLTVTADPLTSTQPTAMFFEENQLTRTNLILNPSFESGLIGWTAEVGATLTPNTDASDGTSAIRVETAATNAGFQNGGGLTYLPDVVPLGNYTLSFDAKRIIGTRQFYIRMYALDVAGNTVATLFNNFIYLSDNYNRYAWLVPMPETAYKFRFQVVAPSSTARTFLIDNILFERSAHIGAGFNGNSIDARWFSTANESRSIMPAPSVKAISPYIGDSNENNQTFVQLHHQEDAGQPYPFVLPSQAIRSTRRWESSLSPSYGMYNLVRNPSFEIDDVFWSGGTRTGDSATSGQYSYFAALTASYVPRISVKPSTTYTIQATVKPDPEGILRVSVDKRNTSEVLTTTTVGEYVYGTGQDWILVSHTFTTTSTEHFVSVSFIGDKPFYLDSVLMIQASSVVPYRDGSIKDGVWEGLPHKSSSGVQLRAGNPYNVSFTYTDPEGFFDITEDTEYKVSGEYIPSQAPDDTTTLTQLRLTANETSIYAEAFYLGDDNNNNTALIEFKRTDLNSWSQLRPIMDRSKKRIAANIPDLRAGTKYTVRVVVDDIDGVYGASNKTLLEEATTGYPKTATDSDPYISFGGFVLMGRDDAKIAVKAHDAFGFPNRRVEIEELPRIDGSIQLQSLWGTKRILMSGFISGDSRADLEDVRGALIRGLSGSNQRLVVDSLSRRGRFYYATVETLDIEENGSENITHLEWSASFLCADPFAHDIVETNVSKTTLYDKGEISLVNDGDARVNPYFEISTNNPIPLTVTMINHSTGERITPKKTIIRGDRLVIDSERRSMTKNGVEIDYAGGFPQLASGSNKFAFTIPPFGPVLGLYLEGFINVSARWRNKYL